MYTHTHLCSCAGMAMQKYVYAYQHIQYIGMCPPPHTVHINQSVVILYAILIYCTYIRMYMY